LGSDEPRLWPFYSERAVARVTARVRAGTMYSTSGDDPDIAACERRLADVLLPGASAVLCNSGTAALASAYFALALEPGAEVLVPSNTFRATATPLLALGLRPVLCDSLPDDGRIDLADAARRVTSRTRALVVTHLWGRPVPLDDARALADRHGLALVEDCSHAHGTRWRGRPVGSAGHVAAFSLGTTKMVSGGLAGVLLTADRDVYERALVFGQPKHRALADVADPALRALAETGLGHNLRPSPAAAILCDDHLDRVPTTVAVRNRNLARLDELLGALLPALRPLGRDHAHGTLYKFHCRWTDPDVPADRVVQLLRTAGLAVRHPAKALHRTPLFTDPGLLDGGLPGPVRALPGDFPGTERCMTDLVEFAGRDLYEDSEPALARYEAAFRRAGAALAEGRARC
jgi:perosamine synthetase